MRLETHSRLMSTTLFFYEGKMLTFFFKQDLINYARSKKIVVNRSPRQKPCLLRSRERSFDTRSTYALG